MKTNNDDKEEIKDEIKVRLIISGFKCNPDEITNTLSLTPSETWICGETIKKTIAKYKRNGWQIDSPNIHENLEGQTKALVSILKSVITRFKLLPKEAEIELSCIIYTYIGRPEVFFPSDIVKFLGEIGAQIDVDIYDLSENSEEIEN